MYSRKQSERDLLHRLSHINDIHKQTMLQDRDIKDARMESMSMQEAIAYCMQCSVAETIVEACQVSNQRKEDAKERTKEQRERQRKTPGVPIDSMPQMDQEMTQPKNLYDMLDEKRCAGFLLSSYDRYGKHSILGEGIKCGDYKSHMTDNKQNK